MAEIRMTWNVLGVLKLTDSFTGKPPLLSSIRVVVEEGLSVIKKQDGILVFVEDRNYKPRPSFHAWLESPVYVRTEAVFSIGERPETLCIWMNPTEQYPAPAGTTRLYGQTFPNAFVFFCFLEEAHPMRLLSDMENGHASIRLYHPGRRTLEGRKIELENGKRRTVLLLGNAMECSGQESSMEMKEYAVKPEDGFETFWRSETTVRLVYETKADQNGRYMLFFKDIKGESAPGQLSFITSTKQIELNAVVRRQTVTRLDGPRE